MQHSGAHNVRRLLCATFCLRNGSAPAFCGLELLYPLSLALKGPSNAFAAVGWYGMTGAIPFANASEPVDLHLLPMRRGMPLLKVLLSCLSTTLRVPTQCKPDASQTLHPLTTSYDSNLWQDYVPRYCLAWYSWPSPKLPRWPSGQPQVLHQAGRALAHLGSDC